MAFWQVAKIITDNYSTIVLIIIYLRNISKVIFIILFWTKTLRIALDLSKISSQ